MDFKSIKEKALGLKDSALWLKDKALWLKDKALEMKDKTVDATAKKFSTSSMVLKSQKELEEFIQTSENKVITTQYWEEKIFTRRSIVVFWEWNLEYYKEFLLAFPVLITKSFSQNIKIKMMDCLIEGLDLSSLEEVNYPCLVVYENKEIYGKIEGEENIKKIIKSLSLDINSTIEEMMA